MIIAQSARLVGGKRLKTQVSIKGGYIWSSCFHFTLVSESGFLDPGHNHYRRLISIMPLSALSPVPDFLLWSPSSYYNPTFLLSSDSVFSTKNAPKLQKQFPSMTACPEEDTGWGNCFTDESEDLRHKFEIDFGGDLEKFHDYRPQAFRWCCCGLEADVPYGCDHHGSGTRPCTCDYCRQAWLALCSHR